MSLRKIMDALGIPAWVGAPVTPMTQFARALHWYLIARAEDTNICLECGAVNWKVVKCHQPLVLVLRGFFKDKN